MSPDQQNSSAFEKEVIKVEITEGLRHALDKNFRLMLEAARKDWERLFSGKEPSDACVSVNISEAPKDKKLSRPRAGFLLAPKAPRPGKTKTRLA
ncbi:MAG: hypothetical protein QOI04_752 [Verrucomicrobiota bacterium]|jgi:hypothetical protein